MLNTIIEELFAIDSIKVGQFTLKSGQTSPIYIDLRPIVSRPALLSKIAEVIWQQHTAKTDFICGVPYTALPIATAISLSQQVPMLLRRKEIKDYGTKKTVEGLFKPDECCVIIEDVVTTGLSIIETVKDLEQAGLKVVEVVSFLNREQKKHSDFAKIQPIFRSALTLTQVAEHLYNAGLIDLKLKEAILAL